jgi:hypothetical protein
MVQEVSSTQNVVVLTRQEMKIANCCNARTAFEGLSLGSYLLRYANHAIDKGTSRSL